MTNFNAPKKSLGQNFLKSGEVRDLIVKKIVEVLAVNPDKKPTLLEIGPGRGFITKGLLELAENFSKIILVEKDNELAEYLKTMPEIESLGDKVEIVNADFLEFNLSTLGQNYIAYGSLPYNVSKRIIDILITSQNAPIYSLFIIQKEVAEDYSSAAGRKFLGAYSELYAESKILKNIPPEWFNPAPKVNSSLIEFVPVSLDLSPDEKTKVRKLMRLGFSQPRKTLFNNLKSLGKREEVQNWITENFENEKARPGDLTREQWMDLAELL